MSTKLKRAVFDACKWTHPVTKRIMLTCHLCDGEIDAALGTNRQSPHAWDAEHIKRKKDGGEDTPGVNVLPAHTVCHRPKTGRENRESAKGVRVRDKHFGIERKQGFWKPEGVKFNWRSRRYERESETS